MLVRPLLGLLHAFLSLDYNDPTLSLGLHSCYLGFLDPFHCLRASLAHFFLIGHPRPILILHFHGYFANSFGFPQPNYHIFYFWGLWAFHQPLTHLLHYFKLSLAHSCFPFHIMLMGLLLSLGSFRPTCFL